MELLALIFIWPFLIFSVGLIVIALSDLGPGSWLGFGWLWPILFIVLIVWRSKLRGFGKEKSKLEQLQLFRGWLITFSIALLLPFFVRYLVETFSYSLGAVIVGLAVSFGLVLWGMHMKTRRVLMYSNIVGGALSLIYVYTQLWSLGEFARIVAAGFGLIVAVVVAIAKLKDKLS